jgi:hypothetical protein
MGGSRQAATIFVEPSDNLQQKNEFHISRRREIPMIGHSARILFCVILSFQMIFGFSKGSYFFPEITFKDVPLKELDKDKTLKIVKALKDYKRIFGPADVYDTVNHFYRSDIDNDKKSELIYYGITCAGGYWTIIWKADGKSYRLMCELYGKINGISESLFISTLAPACRGPNCGHADLFCGYANCYRIMDDEASFLRSVAIFKGVAIHDSPPVKKRIVINNTGYVLRAQPVINDKPDSTAMERFGVLRGNTIVELGKGTVASATAAHTDNAGNEWWFLVLENPLEVKYNIYKEFTRDNRRICGWIFTNGLEYKEIL